MYSLYICNSRCEPYSADRNCMLILYHMLLWLGHYSICTSVGCKAWIMKIKSDVSGKITVHGLLLNCNYYKTCMESCWAVNCSLCMTCKIKQSKATIQSNEKNTQNFSTLRVLYTTIATSLNNLCNEWAKGTALRNRSSEPFLWQTDWPL